MDRPLDQIDKNKLPQHLAIIMDGNGRWAKAKGLFRSMGHENGTKAVREITEACAQINIPYLTLYAFSTENWNRPKLEVELLMRLLVSSLKKEVKKNIMEIKLSIKTNRDLYCKNPLNTNSSINGMSNINGKIFEKLNLFKSLSSIKDSCVINDFRYPAKKLRIASNRNKVKSCLKTPLNF